MDRKLAWILGGGAAVLLLTLWIYYPGKPKPPPPEERKFLHCPNCLRERPYLEKFEDQLREHVNL